MIVYHATREKFNFDVLNNTIADNIEQAFITHLGRKTSPNEVKSWKNSMMYMNNVLNTNSISPKVLVTIEFQIPRTSKRIDFIISGLDKNNKKSIIIIELKQWEKAKLTTKEDIVITRFQHGEVETTHPSYQAWSYAYMLKSYNEAVEKEGIILKPCAFLHNYTKDDVINNSIYSQFTSRAPVFFKSDSIKLQRYICQNISREAKIDIIELIDKGRIRPSKQLAETLSSMLRGNLEFVLIDEQKVIYEKALALARMSKTKEKTVLIVKGGPGTGKSVVAINLLVQLISEGFNSQYVTKNSAPRDVYKNKLGEFKKKYIDNLFVGSGTFYKLEKNAYDALIVDEAHRLNYKSGLFSNLGENQIKEIINASKFSIFFVDDRQKIHIKDIGSSKTIERFANECGAKVHHDKLNAQFRCNGSDGYLSWLDNVLEIDETANIFLTEEDYDFKIFDDPNQLFLAIKDKNNLNNKSRVVAGYCWDWESKKDPNKYDVKIPEFSFYKKWNLKSYSTPWIINPDSIDEIGCIHTCQGLELDYVGVIVGNDITYANGKVTTHIEKRSKNDQSIKGFKKLLKSNKDSANQQIDEIIKNTYRTLFTRGMKGCYVYFCNKELAEHFKEKLKPVDRRKEIKDEIRIEPTVNDEVKYIDFLPYYSIRAACGYFGEGEVVDVGGWIKVEGIGKLNRNMFIVRAVGDSMEPAISNGDFCVFRANPAGSRQNKIVLAQHHNFYDPDNAGGFSIKVYRSEKAIDEDGSWMHESISLIPKNKDYTPIVINPEDSDDFRIVGEFVCKIDNSL